MSAAARYRMGSSACGVVVEEGGGLSGGKVS